MRSSRYLRPFVAVLLPFAAACAGHRAPPPVPEPMHVVLEESPIWTAAAAWDRGEEHLVLLDPGHRRLLAYDRSGRVARVVELDRLAPLDYSTPIRLLATDDGMLLGDRRYLVRFNRDLEGGEATDLFAELAADGVAEGSLNDFVVVGDSLFGFADFRRSHEAEEEWHRGIVRLDLRRWRLETLLELSLDDGEFTEYYYYDRRPYVAALGRRVFLLRFTDPPVVCRVSRAGLTLLATIEEPDLRAVALHAWGGRLYVLLSSRSRLEEAARLVDSGASRGEVRRRLAGPLPTPAAREWVLLALDPKSGQVLGRRRLPTTAERVRLVPGSREWALVEESLRPEEGEIGARVQVLFLPATWTESPTYSH